MRQARTAMSVVVVTLLAVGGCGGEDPAGDSSAETSPPPAAESSPSPGEPDDSGESGDDAPAEAVPELLDFRASTVDGDEFDAATLAGEPAVFWFWASWCPRCAAFASDLRQVQADYQDQVNVVGVAGRGSGEANMREFISNHDLAAFPHLSDDDGEVWVRFDVNIQEYIVILDARGNVVHEGPTTAQELRDQLQSLVG